MEEVPDLQGDGQGEGEKMNLDVYDLSRREWEALIDQWIFKERDRAILKRRLLDGICFQPLAEEFDLSVQQTKSVVYKSQSKLFRHLK